VNIVLDLDLTFRGSNSITSFVYYYVSVAVCVFGCMCVCVEGEEDSGIRGIVQYVTFSIDVSFFRCKTDCVNYKKHT